MHASGVTEISQVTSALCITNLHPVPESDNLTNQTDRFASFSYKNGTDTTIYIYIYCKKPENRKKNIKNLFVHIFVMYGDIPHTL